jgi:diguanylate cyclase (GGDEF)-like protein
VIALRFESLTSAAPLLLAPLVVIAALRGEVPGVEAGAFVVLLFGWGAALALAKSRAETRARTLGERRELDASVQRAVTMAESEDDLLDVAGHAVAQVLPVAPAEILLTDESGSEIHLGAIARAGAPGCPVDAAAGCPALRTGQTQTFPRPNAIDVCPRLRARPGGPKPALCVPLSVMGRTIGVLHATTTSERPFAEHEIVSLESIASHVGSRLRMLQMVDELQRQATTDALTSLPNRRSFEERAARALLGRPSVVAIADLDHFKRLNDTFGHAAGDQALRVFSDSLRRSFAGRHDIVARLGGEEFAIIVPRTTVDDVRRMFEKARADLAETLVRQGAASFTVSFGVALAPEHGAGIVELLAAADRALYRAKAGGRDQTVLVGDPAAELAAPSEPRAGEGGLRKISIVPPAPDVAAQTDRTRGAA